MMVLVQIRDENVAQTKSKEPQQVTGAVQACLALISGSAVLNMVGANLAFALNAAGLGYVMVAVSLAVFGVVYYCEERLGLYGEEGSTRE